MENEYFFAENYGLVRPGLKMISMRAAIALIKEDNRREEADVFKPGYTGELLRMQKKIRETQAGGVKYLMSDSRESDMDEALKERRRREKDMVIDENEERHWQEE